MFTGIVEQVGIIEKIEGNRFTISHSFTEDFEVGESVSVNGVCLTVISIDNKSVDKRQYKGNDFSLLTIDYCLLTVEIIEESRNVTTFGDCEVGDKVNLERAARIGERNSGHNVTGHIDQVGKILHLEKKSDYHLIRIGIDSDQRKLVVHKGSVAVEGISLTISGVSENAINASNASKEQSWFEVSIISHTWEETNLHLKKEGDGVNVEFDILGKYILNNIQ